MAYSPQFGAYPRASAATTAVFDAGLRAYMLRVYNWMASGLLLTGVVAYAIANTSLINAFYPLVQTPFGGFAHQPTALAMIAIFAPLAFVLVLSLGVNKRSCGCSLSPPPLLGRPACTATRRNLTLAVWAAS
jgi:FtsH-binding integral membrane protein